MTSRVNELSTFQRSVLPTVKSPDPPSPGEILDAIRAGVVWVWERDCASNGKLQGNPSPGTTFDLPVPDTIDNIVPKGRDYIIYADTTTQI